jgi:hypothetical protein
MRASRRCLLAYGCELPSLDWGIGEPRLDPAVIERMGLQRAKRLGEVGARGGGTDSSPRIGTPEPFRDLLSAKTALRTIPRHSRICRRARSCSVAESGTAALQAAFLR